MAEQNLVLLATLLVLCSLLIGGLVTYVAFPQEKNTITYVDKPVLVEVPTANLSNDVATIKAQVTERDTWKADAQKLAEAEWNNLKDIYNFLDDEGVAISDKSDISKVVIKDTEVSNTDVEDKDAEVVQEVRVYYEDSSGEDKRANLIVTTTISDGDVDEVTYELD